MSQSLCSFRTRPKPQTTLVKTKDFAISTTPTKQSMQNSTTLDTNSTKETAQLPPVEIGTRGTIASLIMQEIDYFSKIELNSQDKPQRNKIQITEVGSSISTSSRTTIVSTVEESTKKKRASSKLLPSMCSMVDVSDNGRPNGTSAFSYRNLKSDTKKFHV
ncbi:hypothetical protein RJT34_10944 [Clitoria ternatea]|uniref:Uncharacterized protein n=1 Tax=Clitoria ternatea TaxID=43366 RepID=A0AAN9PHZ9_CLITE